MMKASPSWEARSQKLNPKREVRQMKKAMVFGVLTLLVACMGFNAMPVSAAEKFVVGWQPYYIDSFSPAVIQELGLVKKYLPGVEVEFQEALHTAVYSGR